MLVLIGFRKNTFIYHLIVKIEELKAMANNYSAFVVGSDQLWRTDSVEHGYYTLEWVPDNICKIAYSTSLGIKKVPWFQRKKEQMVYETF